MKKITAYLTPLFLLSCSPQQEQDNHAQPPTPAAAPTLPKTVTQKPLKKFKIPQLDDLFLKILPETADDDIKPKLPPAFTATHYGDKQVFATQGAMNSMNAQNGFDLKEQMAELAGQDIILIDSRDAKKIGLAEWYSLPLWEKADELGLETTSSIKEGLLKTLRQSAVEAHMTRNYFTMNLNEYDNNRDTACIITGNLKHMPQDHFMSLGHLREEWKDSIVINGYDAFSYMTLIMLHEAAHCAQNGISPEDVKAYNIKSGTAFTLYGEIDADKRAINHYNKLIKQGWPLNPGLTNSIKNVRMIAPLMESVNTTLYSVLDQQLSSGFTHATGNALLSDNDAINYQDETKIPGQLNVMIFVVGYQLLSEQQKAEVAAEAEKLSKNIHDRFELDFLIQAEDKQIVADLLDSLMPTFTAMQAFQSYARKHPEVIFETLSVINRHSFLNEESAETDPKNHYNMTKIKNMALALRRSYAALMPAYADKAQNAEAFDALFEYNDDGAIIVKRMKVFLLLESGAERLKKSAALQQALKKAEEPTPSP